MLTLWGIATPRSLRAHWALHELGLEYVTEAVGSRTGQTQSPQFQALNAKEKIPVLVDDDLVLTESGAIVTYLGSRYGSSEPDSALVPADPKQRARYDEWLSYVLMELDAHTLYILRKHRDLAELYGAAPAAVEAAIAGFDKQVRFARERLGDQPYAMGAHFSGVDIVLDTTLEWARVYGFTLAPTLDEYRQRLRQRTAFQAAWQANQMPAL